MSKKRQVLIAGMWLLAASRVLAQESGGDAAARQQALREEARVEQELAEATAEIESAAIEIEKAVRVDEAGNVDVEVEMRDAESRLADAARRVAELSMQRLPQLARHWTTEIDARPVLGITIRDRETGQPVEGVEVSGVTPGGAAGEAGLRAGDVIASINGTSLGADSAASANARLLDFMSGVEPGDVLEIEYLRNGTSGQVALEPRSAEPRFFGFHGPGPDFRVPMPPDAVAAPAVPPAVGNRFVFITEAGGLGDMEMVTLTKGLGRYFGTDEGLLVVRAPEDADTYKLEDGDVILNIDGREPKSVSHAVRILGSYQAGESLTIRIMRDRRARTLEIELPDERTGALGNGSGAVVVMQAPAATPAEPPAPVEPPPRTD